MTIEQPIFAKRDPDADRKSDALAEADIRAGRLIDDGEVASWLAKWGTPAATPMPREWLE